MEQVEIAADDVEAEACAFDVEGVAAAEEAAEEVLLIFFGDADSAVADGDRDGARLGAAFEVDGCIFGAELDGVAEQINQNIF